MDSDIQLISDGDGLEVSDDQNAVEEFLRSALQWGPSQNLDRRRLGPLHAHFAIDPDLNWVHDQSK
jgi:hypothetical protein